MHLPRAVVYVDEKTHPFYAPEHFKVERPFVLYPRDSVLVILNQHNNLECYTRKLRDGGKSLSWRYFSGDKLGLVVKNCTKPGTGTNIVVHKHSSLAQLLHLSQVQSHWALLDKDIYDTATIPKKNNNNNNNNNNNKRTRSHPHPPPKKMKKEERTENRECCFSYTENDDDDDDDDDNSCTSSCDHSDIDDCAPSKMDDDDDDDDDVLILN
jgi:hypothetical protein